MSRAWARGEKPVSGREAVRPPVPGKWVQASGREAVRA